MNRAKEELELVKCIVDLFPVDVIREVEIKKQQLQQDNYFGNCSVCGENDGNLNIAADHYFVCHKHKKKWYVGSNLFSGWRDETEKLWKKNHKTIKKYEKINGYEWVNNIINPGIEKDSSLPF
jgi:hypothetical protein